MLGQNPFEKREDIYILPSAEKFSYSDGDDVEKYLNKVLSTSSDLSSYSAELESHIYDWATEYHLSSKRANLLRGFDLSNIQNALELGCGCGAITRYLGEQGIQVDAVEGSQSRLELAASRCRGLTGINFFCANFNELELPDNHYDVVIFVGVTEYAARFMPEAESSEEAVRLLLQKTSKALKPNGVILIAIENRIGLKYVIGAHEDHYARKYIGIHNYFDKNDIKTYSLNEWMDIFSQLGFENVTTYLPFPDYKIPTVVLSRDYALKNPNAYCHLEGLISRDYISYTQYGISEPLFWQAASANQTLTEYANSFLFMVSFEKEPVEFGNIDFAHLPSFHRKREYCVITKKLLGEGTVIRSKIVDQVNGKPNWVSQRLENEPYHQGALLSVHWIRALLIEPEGDRFIDLLKQYYVYLKSRDQVTIDLLPINIVVGIDGDFHGFDEEWVIDQPVSIEYLIFRALLNLSVSAHYSIQKYAELNRLDTIEDFLVYAGRQIDVDLKPHLVEFVELEERFHEQVALHRDENHTLKHLGMTIKGDETVRRKTAAKIYWKSYKENYSEENSCTTFVDAADELQTISFTLPPRAGKAKIMRFDPCDENRHRGVGYLRFYSIKIKTTGSRDSDSECIWALTSQREIFDNTEMSGVEYKHGQLGEMFIVTDDDPWFEFRFIPRRSLRDDENLFVEIRIRMPASEDYLLAKDIYLDKVERLQTEFQHLEDADARLKQLTEELDEIKKSRAWRAVQIYRKNLYEKIHLMVKTLAKWKEIYRKQGYQYTYRRILKSINQRILISRGTPVDKLGMLTNYEIWLEKYFVQGREETTGDIKFSIVMPVYNISPNVLKRAVDSVITQTYKNWELCIVDDASSKTATIEFLSSLRDERIKIKFLEQNLNISGASNAAVELAQGDYLCFMDNDDELATSALAELAHAVTNESADIIYTDEDFIKIDGHLDFPHFKPDYNPDLLLSHNYITHFLAVRRKLFDEVGGFRTAYDGAQDYDLLLRLTERTGSIFHIPKPLYHWRMSKDSTSLNPDIKPGAHEKAKMALENAIQRRKIDATVEDTDSSHFFRVKRRIRNQPKVSIIIPFKDKPILLRRCIESVVNHSSYQNYEIIGVSNDSTSSSVYDEMQVLETLDDRIRFIEYNVEFNFSKIVNRGVEEARGDHIILLNNDIEIITQQWIENLLEHSQRSEVAVTGGKLYYPNNTIQHAGIMIGLGGYAGHPHQNFPAHSHGYFNRLQTIQNASAITGALMMVEKSIYDSLQGFDETSFAIAYNDVDFCLRARSAGYLNVFTPYVEAYHRESLSRGYENTAEKMARFEQEMNNLTQKHGALIKRGDPYYNPNFDQNRDNFSLES